MGPGNGPSHGYDRKVYADEGTMPPPNQVAANPQPPAAPATVGSDANPAPTPAQQLITDWNNNFGQSLQGSASFGPGTMYTWCKLAMQCSYLGAPGILDVAMSPLSSADSSAFEAHFSGTFFKPLNPNDPLSSPLDQTVKGLAITRAPGWPGGPNPLPAQQPPAPTPSPSPSPSPTPISSPTPTPPPAPAIGTFVNPLNPFSAPQYPTTGPAAVK